MNAGVAIHAATGFDLKRDAAQVATFEDRAQCRQRRLRILSVVGAFPRYGMRAID